MLKRRIESPTKKNPIIQVPDRKKSPQKNTNVLVSSEQPITDKKTDKYPLIKFLKKKGSQLSESVKKQSETAYQYTRRITDGIQEKTISFAKEASTFIFIVSEKETTTKAGQEAKAEEFILKLLKKEGEPVLSINTVHLTMRKDGLEYDTLDPKDKKPVNRFISNTEFEYTVTELTTIDDLSTADNIQAFFNIYNFLLKEGHFYKHKLLEDSVKEAAVLQPEILEEVNAVNDSLADSHKKSLASKDSNDSQTKNLPQIPKNEKIIELNLPPSDLPPPLPSTLHSILNSNLAPSDLPPPLPSTLHSILNSNLAPSDLPPPLPSILHSILNSNLAPSDLPPPLPSTLDTVNTPCALSSNLQPNNSHQILEEAQITEKTIIPTNKRKEENHPVQQNSNQIKVKNTYRHAANTDNDGRSYHFYNEVNGMASSNSNYTNHKGDHLKTVILKEFQKCINNSQSLDDFQTLKQNIMATNNMKTKLLRQKQGLFFTIFDIQTSSMDALDQMLDERENQLNQNQLKK